MPSLQSREGLKSKNETKTDIIISLLILKLAIKQESLNQSYDYCIENDRVAGKTVLRPGEEGWAG